jgi:hypothetical protein
MASISGNQKIVLKARYSEGGAEHEEGILEAAAYPGQNVTISPAAADQEVHHWNPDGTDYAGTGTDITVVKGSINILCEDSLQGLTILDQYSAGGRARIHKALSGEHLQVLAASGENWSKGDGVKADTTGKWVADSTNPVAVALESTGGALGADAHVRVLVL